MFKKNYLFILFLLLIVSCSTANKNNQLFIQFLSREKYMLEQEPSRVFNPGSAMLIATLPDNIGNFKSSGEINDFEMLNNGSGYSKRYINNKIGKGYWIDIFSYHARQPQISDDIDNEIVKTVYNNAKNDILNSHANSKILGENLIIFTTPDGKTLKMKELIFTYYNQNENTYVKSYMYFGTSLDSFFKIRISYNTNIDSEEFLFSEKEHFIKDFGYYYTDGMSLNDFNSFKKSNLNNPIKIQRVKK